MNIGERIKLLRLKKGMTQEELAIKLGYKSKSSVAHIENGRDIPRSMVVTLAKILETTPASLMGWEDEWDKAAEEFEKGLQSDSEWLKNYLSERFSDEDVSTAYELIEQLPKFNKDGLIKIIERMDELSELKKYLNQIDLVE